MVPTNCYVLAIKLFCSGCHGTHAMLAFFQSGGKLGIFHRKHLDIT
jgi:hypothetical protein